MPSFAAPDFQMTTPMLVQPYAAFKEQGRIQKSVKQWRDQALKDGRLVKFDEKTMVGIFLSHTWWDREYTDSTNDKKDPYDKGAPDYQKEYDGARTKNKKWQIICDGVEALAKQKGVPLSKVVLWLDWQSIYQDNKAEKLKGVNSLIKYATLCKYMLIPTEAKHRPDKPYKIDGYGSRGWCRAEYFIFQTWAEMLQQDVELYAIYTPERRGFEYATEDELEAMSNSRFAMYSQEREAYEEAKKNGVEPAKVELAHFSSAQVYAAHQLPSNGQLSNPADKLLVQKLEDDMIQAYGKTAITTACTNGARDRACILAHKMVREVHMPLLVKAVDQHRVTMLQLNTCQLGSSGVTALADAFAKGAFKSLAKLGLGENSIGPKGAKALAVLLKHAKGLEELDLVRNPLCHDDNTYNVSGFKEMVSALAANPKLKVLVLCGCGLRAEGGQALGAALQHNSALTKLVVAHNFVGPAGGKAIADGLMSNKSLTELDFSQNLLGGALRGGNSWVSDESCALAIAKLLETNRALTSIELGMNGLSKRGGLAIAHALGANKSLKRLMLEGNDFSASDEAGKALRLRVTNRGEFKETPQGLLGTMLYAGKGLQVQVAADPECAWGPEVIEMVADELNKAPHLK